MSASREELIKIIERLLYFHGDLVQHGQCSFCEMRIHEADHVCVNPECPVREALWAVKR